MLKRRFMNSPLANRWIIWANNVVIRNIKRWALSGDPYFQWELETRKLAYSELTGTVLDLGSNAPVHLNWTNQAPDT